MEDQIRIYVEDRGFLELSKEFPVALTFNVADIADISKKSGAYSKTIELPATKQNNQVLGQLFDINLTNSSFNIHRKTKCKVISKDVVVMDGFIKLEAVKKLSKTSIGGEQEIYYKATLFDQAANFFDQLGNSLLEDLDFSQYNHLYSGSTVLASSASTASDVYTYPMLYNTNATAYQLQDFFPAIYTKAYLDKIFEAAQYSYESDFLTGASEDGLFTKLIVPFNQERPVNSQDVLNSRKFNIGWTGATSSIRYSGTSLFVDHKLEFNDDTNSPRFDSGNTYNVASSKVIAASNQLSDFRIRIPITLSYYADQGATLELNNGGWGSNPSANRPYFKPRVIVKKNGLPVSIVTATNPVYLPVTIASGETQLQGINIDVTLPNIDLSVADELEFYINPSTNSSAFYSYKSGSTVVQPSFIVDYAINTTGETLSLTNAPKQTNLAAGDTVFMNDFLPKNVKQKDFLKWLVQMFNLYIEPHPDNDNKLVIKTREEYYENNKFVDWTSKLALDRNLEYKFLPELQSRDLVLTYKTGGDEWSKLYKDNFKETYGRKKFTFDNDYLKGEKKIEVGFESTPLAENGFGLIVPTIASDKPKTGIKLLYKPDSWLAGDWAFTYNKNGTTETVSLSGYPYAGHFDQPTDPTVDLNFGECRQLFYWQYNTITDNTLGNRFYSPYVQQIIDGKLITAFFDLNEVDVLNLDFSSRVFVKDTYYYLNKIIDYNPLANSLTKVELIKADAPLKFKRKFRGTIPEVDTTVGDTVSNPNNPFPPVLPVVGNFTNNDTKNPTTTVIGEGNTIDVNSQVRLVGNSNQVLGESSGSIVGSNNKTSGGKLQVIGDFNAITGNTTGKAFILGDFNNITSASTNAFVFGSNNLVEAEGAQIFGNAITADTANTVFANNLTVTTGGTLTLGDGTTITGSTDLGNIDEDRLKFTGDETVFNDVGDNFDFRIESQSQQNIFFVDAANNAIGIATGTPTDGLDIRLGTLFNNSVAFANRTFTSNNTLAEEGSLVFVDTSAGSPITITLPYISGVTSGHLYIVKDLGTASVDNVTVTPSGSEKIDGAGSAVISTNYGVLRITTDGSEWLTV